MFMHLTRIGVALIRWKQCVIMQATQFNQTVRAMMQIQVPGARKDATYQKRHKWLQ